MIGSGWKCTCALGLAIAAVASGVTAHAATYYVSNAGSDAAPGTAASPFATLAKAASVARTGDTLLLARGSTFRETVTSAAPGLTVDAYGSPSLSKPVISGSTRVTNWQPYSSNVYVANVSGDLGYVFANNQAMTLARFPNSGWLRTSTWTEGADGSNTVVSTASLATNLRSLAGSYWTGANIRWHRHSWWFETRTVTNSTPTGQLSLAGQSFIPITPYDKNGWGFYLDNKFEELDAPGEYYHDKAAGKLYFYAPNGANPNNLTVEASSRTTGLSLTNATVRNVAFQHQKEYGLQISGTTVVENNLFSGIGSDAGGQALWATWNTKNAVVRNNTFSDNLATAITWNEAPNSGSASVIERNTLTNTGTVDGYGGTGSWKNAGIVVTNGTNVRAQYNRIDGVGYAGIIFNSPGNFAEYNVIDNAMMTLNDGAAIYTNTSSSTIRNNIIRNTRGGMESSGPWGNLAHGIWTEYLGDYNNQTITGNTVVNSGAWGIYFDNNFTSVVKDNVLFGNDGGQLELSGVTSKPAQNHLITGNVLVGTSAGELSLQFKRGVNYGTIANNHYLNAATDRVIAAFDETWSPFAAITIAQWTSQYPGVADAGARTLGQLLIGLPLAAPELFLNDTESLMTLLLTRSYVDLQGRQYAGQLQLDPLDSLVLIPHPLYGDANLDGRVNSLDRAMIILGGPATWSTGDFNHDGRVNADDLTLFDLSQARYANGIGIPGAFATVPEPGIAGAVVALTGATAVTRRRPRH